MVLLMILSDWVININIKNNNSLKNASIKNTCNILFIRIYPL